MRFIFRSTFVLAIVAALTATSEATLIQAGFFFDANDGADVSTISQTVTAANGNITFNFDVAISVNGGAAFDSTAGAGIAGTAGGNLTTGDVVTYSLSISGITQNGPHLINLQDLSFRFLGTDTANATADTGRLDTGGAGTATWADANGPGSDFSGHLPGGTTYGGGATDGFFVRRSTGVQQTGAFDVQAGFDIPRTAIWNGAPYGTPIVSFSQTVLGGAFSIYRLDDLVVQVHATPEPTSFALGFVALLSGGGAVWRRRKAAAVEALA